MFVRTIHADEPFPVAAEILVPVPPSLHVCMEPINPEPLPRQLRLDHYTQRTTKWLSALALVYLVTFSIQSIWPDPAAP